MRKLILVAALMLSACADDPYRVIKQWGYTPLQPASLFTGPGKVYAVETPDGRPWKEGMSAKRNLTEICAQDSSFLTAKTFESSGPEVEAKSKLIAETSISAVDLADIQAKAQFKVVRDVKRSITDVKFMSMPDDLINEVRDIIAKNNPGCRQVIRDRLSSGFDVAFSQGVVQVFMTYSVEYAVDLTAEAKAQLTAELAPTLSQKFSLSGADKITVSGLYMGQKPYYRRPANTETLADLAVIREQDLAWSQ